MDEDRLYEVTERGWAWTARQDPRRVERRRAHLRWTLGLGIAVNAASWSLAGIALWLGGEAWGAGFGVLAVLSLPLLALPALVEGAARLRRWRRHHSRPEDFPAPDARLPSEGHPRDSQDRQGREFVRSP